MTDARPERWRDSARRAVPRPLRRRLFRVRRAVRRRLRGEHRPWVRTEPEPASPTPVEHFELFAIVGTWMEGDVIADTVANAFTQGVGRVFLIDNDSPDDTVRRAVGAGAEHVLTYSTPTFDEQYRYNLMNEFVRHRSAGSDANHVWWLWLDADEFPRPEGGGTIRELVARLDRQYRIVGGRVVDHYPTPGRPAFVAGDHPLDHQPLADERTMPMCARGHRKHPLQRWDRSGPPIVCGPGFHGATCAQRPLHEPPSSVVIDHFPFREEAVSRRRLAALWGLHEGAPRTVRGEVSSMHMEARLDSLTAVYAGDWSRVRDFGSDHVEHGVHPVHWRDLDPPISTDVRRWGVRRRVPA